MDESLKAEHEAGLALFLEPSSRGRFRHALTSARARSKFTAKLAHFAHLDQRFATKVIDKSLVAAKLHKSRCAEGLLCHVRGLRNRWTLHPC